MVTKTVLSTSERQLLKDAPHWLHIALRASKGGAGLIRGARDPETVPTILAEYKSDTPLIREVIAARTEKSEAKESASFKETIQTFEQIADLLDQKVNPKEADEFRAFLLDLAEKIAEASREGFFGLGKKVSDEEAEALKTIAVAFRATPEAKKRREAEAAKQREEETKQATAAAQKKEAEAAKEREAEAKKQREAAREATAAAQKKAAEAAKEREAEAKKQREAEAAREAMAAAQKRATEAAKEREAEAEKQREAAREATVAAQKRATEAAKEREAEAKKQREAEATKAVPQEQIYEVKSGDSLSKIAKNLYGDANRWSEIFEANRDKLKDPNLIQPGQKLRIPGQHEVESTRAAIQEQIYEVKSGDSLSKIAKNLYGDANRWSEIFEANRDKLKDPNLIRPGQKLRIP